LPQSTAFAQRHAIERGVGAIQGFSMTVSPDISAWTTCVRRLGVLTLLGLSGCTHVPSAQDAMAPLRTELSERHPSVAMTLPDPADALQSRISALPDLATARALALRNDPQLRQAIVDLGISETAWRDARRPGNPSIAWLRHRGDGDWNGTQWSLSLGITDLLLLPQRTRLREREREQARATLLAQVARTLSATDRAWYGWVGAQLAAEASELLAEAAQLSLELAERFQQAGNLPPVDLAIYRADAARAKVAMIDAKQIAIEFGHALRIQLGLADHDVVLPASTFGLPHTPPDLAQLQALARKFAPALQTARNIHRQREAELLLAQRSAWIGELEMEAEHESRAGETTDTAIGLHWQIPLFEQGQSRRQRARWRLQAAHTDLQTIEQQVMHQVAMSHQRLTALAAQIQLYETALLPALTTAVAEQQKRQNYMLISVFDLLRARRDQFEAAQAYVASLSAYWQTLAALGASIGADLPDMPMPSATFDLAKLLGLGANTSAPLSQPMDHRHHHAQPAAVANPAPEAHTGHHHHED